MENVTHWVADWWSSIWKGAVYFLIPFLPVMGEKLAPFAEKDVWPSPQKWLVYLIFATGAGLVAVKAFLDPGHQQTKDRLNGKHKGDTAPPFKV